MEKSPNTEPMHGKRFDFDAFDKRIVDLIGELVEVVPKPEPPELPPAA